MQTIEIPQKTFIDTLKKLKPFMCKNETKYYLCGVHLEYIASKKKAIFVATDEHRLLTATIPTPTSESEDFSVIIPSVGIENIIKITTKPDDKFTISVETDGIALRFVDIFTNKHTYECKAVDGTYPDWRRIVPDSTDVASFGIDAGYFVDACMALGNKAIVVKQADANTPITMFSETNGDDGVDVKAYIMPKLIPN